MEIPPPHESPLAPEAPELLERFIYHLTHEFAPFGMVDFALQRAQSDRSPLPPGPAKDYATRAARELAYQETLVTK